MIDLFVAVFDAIAHISTPILSARACFSGEAKFLWILSRSRSRGQTCLQRRNFATFFHIASTDAQEHTTILHVEAAKALKSESHAPLL